MKQVTAIIKPFRLNEVRDALNAIGVSGVTVTQVQGYGRQRGQGAVYRGPEYEVKFIPKLKVEVLVVADHAEKGVRDDLEGGSNGAAWGRQGFHSGHKESRAYSHRRVGSRSRLRRVKFGWWRMSLIWRNARSRPWRQSGARRFTPRIRSAVDDIAAHGLVKEWSARGIERLKSLRALKQRTLSASRDHRRSR